MQCVARIEFDLQDARSCVVADGAQFAGVDGFHFHGVSEWKCPRSVAVLDVLVSKCSKTPPDELVVLQVLLAVYTASFLRQLLSGDLAVSLLPYVR